MIDIGKTIPLMTGSKAERKDFEVLFSSSRIRYKLLKNLYSMATFNWTTGLEQTFKT